MIAVEEKKTTDDKELSEMNVKSRKIEAMVINERDGGYVPLFFSVIDQITFTQ